MHFDIIMSNIDRIRWSGHVLLSCALTILPVPAAATWSIVAVDAATGEVGVAGATCGPLVWQIAGVVPGRGVLVAQANTNVEARELGMELLAEALAPEEILAVLTDPAWDRAVESRQYGIAAFNGAAVNFTGDRTPDWHGALGDSEMSAQGNSLRGAEVIDAAEAAFQTAQRAGQPLAERLLLALAAGSAAGGDVRCPAEQTAESAFLFVAQPDDTAGDYLIELKARSRAGGNPVELLVWKYRRLHGTDGRLGEPESLH